ncbi:hypothetical protein [Aeromonas phage Akh-2]|nr:hypothetical protein [Aeromonas phage Akh-2]
MKTYFYRKGTYPNSGYIRSSLGCYKGVVSTCKYISRSLVLLK